MRNYNNREEEKFYIVEETQFKRIYDIISKMPNFVMYNSYEEKYNDYFYDTKDKFLETNRASCRIRKLSDADLLSIKYVSSNAYQEEKERESYIELPKNTVLTQNKKALLFLSNKVNDVYSNRIQIDTVRKFRELEIYMVICTLRNVYQLKNNEDLKINVKFDRCLYQSKFASQTDLIVKIELENYPDSVNLDTFNRFLRELRKKVVLIPDNESKFTAGKRVFNLNRFNKKPVKEEDLEETKNKKMAKNKHLK